MSLLAALVLAQGAYDPEIEALMRHRDEKRAAEARAQIQQEQEKETPSLASVVPPAVAERLSFCLTSADINAEKGLADAQKWAGEDGGPYAAQCKGYALGKARRWSEAIVAFETGAVMPGLDAAGEARLWSQAGNAALANGDAPHALTDFDRALDKPLPATLATGEIHLDRARARVAAGDLKGARGDLDKAVQLASADPLAWLLSATLARRMDDLSLAGAHIEQAAKLSRNDPNIALEQGVIYALSGTRDAAARAAFTRAEETAGKDSAIGRKAAAYLEQLPPVAGPKLN